MRDGKGSYSQGFILPQGEGCGEDVGDSQQTHQRYNPKPPTPKLYTTWARVLSDHNLFCTPQGTTAGSNTPGAFLVFHFLPVGTHVFQ